MSCIDYLALHEVWVLDRATGEDIGSTPISPGARTATLPPSLGDGPVRARTRRITLDVDEVFDGTRLRGTAPRVSFDLLAASRARARVARRGRALASVGTTSAGSSTP